MKAERKPIGEVVCPAKGCELVIPVFRFGSNAQDERYQRRAGKVYCKCSVHGTFGLDGAKGIQDHIMDNGKIWGDQEPGAAAPADASSEPAKAAQASSAAPSSAAKPAARKVPPSTPATAPKERMRLFGWSGRK